MPVMSHAERVAVLVILCGIALALITSLIIFVCCQLVYKINKSRHRSKNSHRTVVFEHQTTTSEDNNGELFSYCFEESTSAHQGESEVHESPSPSPPPKQALPKKSTDPSVVLPGAASLLPDVAKQKISTFNNSVTLPGILSSSGLAAAADPSSVVAATSSNSSSTLHHVTYHQKGAALSQMESSISHTAGGSSSSISSFSRQHQHQRLFAKQQDHRSKRFGRSATLSHAGFPPDPAASHPHGRHHVVFASTSLEVLGVDAASSREQQQQVKHLEKQKPKDNVIEMDPRIGKERGGQKERSEDAGASCAIANTTKTSSTTVASNNSSSNSSSAANASSSLPSGISRQASVDVPEDLRSLPPNPLLSVKGESVDSSESERSPETVKKQYQDLWQLRAEFEAEEKETRSTHDEQEEPPPLGTSSASPLQHSMSSESYRSNEGRITLGDSGYKSLEDRKDYSIDHRSEKIYRQFATPSLGSAGSSLSAVKPASAHPSIEEEDEEGDSEVVIFV